MTIQRVTSYKEVNSSSSPGALALGDINLDTVRRNLGPEGLSNPKASADLAGVPEVASNPSVRVKIRLTQPLRRPTVSSSFGNRRRPEGKNGKQGSKNHRAADFISSDPTVYAAGDGIVIFAENLGSMGSTVIVMHQDEQGQKLATLYGHLNRINVKAGDKVRAGQTNLGVMGNTGTATGTHLHFATAIMHGSGWAYVDPKRFLGWQNFNASVEPTKLPFDQYFAMASKNRGASEGQLASNRRQDGARQEGMTQKGSAGQKPAPRGRPNTNTDLMGSTTLNNIPGGRSNWGPSGNLVLSYEISGSNK